MDDRNRRAESRTHCSGCSSRLLGVFCEVDERHVGLLDRSKVSRRFRRGQALYHEGEQVLGVYCLRSGRVKVSRDTGHGRPHILRIQVPGDLLGLEDLFADSSHGATAEALEEAFACFVDRAAVLEIFETQGRAARSIARELAHVARASEAERTELAVGDVREKVARLLMQLAKRHGRAVEGGVLIDLALSREEIAEMIGAAPESAIRQISALREEGILADSGRSLVISDRARLARAANLHPSRPN